MKEESQAKREGEKEWKQGGKWTSIDILSISLSPLCPVRVGHILPTANTPYNQYVRENGHVWGVWEGMEAIIMGGWSRAEVVGENLDRGREFGVWE